MKKILIIEDDADLQQIYVTKLKHDGFESYVAGAGNEGFELAKKIVPDLIILDVMLPGGPDGFVILKQLKKDPITHAIPVILATNIENQLVNAIDAGAVWYFIKAATPIEAVMDKARSLLK